MCSVDIFTKLTNEVVRFERLKDPLEVCLVTSGTVKDENEDITLIASGLEGERFSSVQQGKMYYEEFGKKE